MANRTAAEHAKDAVQRLYGQKRFTLATLARQVGISSTSIWHYVQGSRTLTLDVLEAVSSAAGVPIAELVAPPDAVLKQLDAEEAALLRAVRSWPKDVLRHLLRFVWFFEDPEPTVAQSRKMHALYRELHETQREWVYGLALALREGAVPLDIQAALLAKVRGEVAAAQATATRRQRTRSRA